MATDAAAPVTATARSAGGIATWGWWWRAGMCVAWAVYLALAYMVARGTAGGWSGIGTVLLGVTGALGAAIFLLPLVALLDAEEVVRATRAGRRFTRGECPACGQPRAPGVGANTGAEASIGTAAGAAAASAAATSTCAECGAAFVRPAPWVPSWTTAGRFAVVFLIALVCGAAAGEWILRTDEADFRQEAPARAAQALAAGATVAGNSASGGTSASGSKLPSSGTYTDASGGTSAEWERYRPWPADFALLRYQSDGRAQNFSAPPPFEFERIPGWQPRRPR